MPVIAVAAWLTAASPAHASTFSFSFTTNQLLDALQAANPATFSRDGYFAVFIQPDVVQLPLGTYSYGSQPVPAHPTGEDRWVGGTYTNTNYLPLGEWIFFSKDEVQTQVRLASVASMYVGFEWDGSVWPVDFGPTTATITGLLPNERFYFQVITSSQITSLKFKGLASAIQPEAGDSLAFGGKPEYRIPFTLELEPIPEPGTFVLMSAALAGLSLGIRRRKDRT